MSKEAPGKTPPADNCPVWAHEMILKLRDLEVQLGNIFPDPSWASTSLEDLMSRTGDEDHEFDESMVEQLFIRIAQGLAEEGYSTDIIAGFINIRLQSTLKLPYCSAAEVIQALN